MNRWIRNALLSSSLVGALALVPSAVAFAADASHADTGHHGHHDRGLGLLGAALKIDSLSADQHAAIAKLVQARQAASAPVRTADAQLLTVLAQQVERAKIEPQALGPSLAAEESAANAQATAERDALNQLHSLLTATQRAQLVDGIVQAHAGHGPRDGGPGDDRETRWLGRALELSPGQESEIRANLQSEGAAGGHAAGVEHGKLLQAFRADSFDAGTFVKAHNRGEGIEKLAAAAVPVLTPTQRATFADHLRRRAAHESAPKGV
jgi:Spy/CpxP family protein refolding chaperone